MPGKKIAIENRCYSINRAVHTAGCPEEKKPERIKVPGRFLLFPKINKTTYLRVLRAFVVKNSLTVTNAWGFPGCRRQEKKN
jgi:hypothetical protein